MQKVSVALLAILLGALGLYIAGCSESTQPPMSQSTQSTLDATTSLTNSIASSEMTLLRFAGIGIEGKGLLSIAWREMFNPCLDTTVAVGRAIAIGYDSVGKSLRKGGIDMGSVFLDYGSRHLELTKHVSHNGNVLYSSSAGPKDGRTNVAFIGNTPYTFDISGSAGFSALNASINAPAALIMMTSPLHRDTVSSNGLTLKWNGGGDSSGVIIAVAALPPPFFEEKDDDHDGEHHDGDDDQGEDEDGASIKAGGMDGVDHHHGKDHKWKIKMPPGGFPPVLDSMRAIIVKLDSNPGTYTVDSTALKNLIVRTGAHRLSCSVSQFILKDVPHDSATVHMVIRNGDGVIVRVK